MSSSDPSVAPAKAGARRAKRIYKSSPAGLCLGPRFRGGDGLAVSFLLLLLAFLPSCGFTPLHGGGGVSARYASIDIPSIPDRDGQALRNLLIDRLYTNGRPHDARYELRVAPLETDYAELGIQKDATITRVQIEITARMTLFDRQTDAAALMRDVRAVGGYDVLDEQYATLVTRRAATERVLEELANSIQTELNLYFKTITP